MNHGHSMSRGARLRRLQRLSGVVLAILALPAALPAAAATWTGGAGPGSPFWDLAFNWDSALPPATGDLALLGLANTTIRSGNWNVSNVSGTGRLSLIGGTLSVGEPSVLGSLDIGTGAAVGGAGILTAGGFTWQGNSAMGLASSVGGVTSVTGLATLGTDIVDFGGPAKLTLNYGRTLNFQGDVAWNYNYLVINGTGVTPGGVAYGPSTLNILAGATMTVGKEAGLLQGTGILNNEGTLRITDGLSIAPTLNNQGTIVIERNGALAFNARHTVLTGTLNIAQGGQAGFSYDLVLGSQVRVQNEGWLSLSAAVPVLFGNGTTRIEGNGQVSLGNVAGTGRLELNNVSWNRATIGSADAVGGVVAFNGPAKIGLSGFNSTGMSVDFGHTLEFNGDVTWDSTDFSGQFKETLAIGGSGVTPGGVAYGASTVTLAAGRTMTVLSDTGGATLGGGGNFNNNGTLALASGRMDVDSAFNNQGTVRADGGVLSWNGTRTLGGALLVGQAGSMSFNGTIALGSQASLVNNGTVTIAGGSLNVGSALDNRGTVNVQATATLQLPANFINHSRLMGKGTILADGLVNEGRIAPGESIGQLTIDGSLIQAAAGSFIAELQSPTLFDQLKVTRATTLDGTLDITCYGDCRFALGQTFTILDGAANQLFGTFAHVKLTGFESGDFSVAYDRLNGDVILSVTHATIPSPPPVPEPASAFLLGAGLAAMGGWAWRRRAGKSPMRV